MPEILVEVVPDFTKLKTGVEELVDNGTLSKEMGALFTDANKSFDAFSARLGKLGDPVQKALKPAIDSAKKSLSTLATSGIKDFGELKKRVDGLTKSFTDGFGEGVEQALNEAGISLKEFQQALQQAEGTGTSLKQELREMTEQLAFMKLRGEENTQQYIELSQKAALYRDTLKDVTDEINKQASDTRKLDTALEFVNGLTSAFTILQGVQALAGDQSEEFQKTMLKVNAAMSILIGLQQIQNVLQKESNLMQFVSNAQRRIGVVVANLENATLSKNIVVKGAATVATNVLNAAMKANPAFILITAFTALAGAIALFTGKTKDAADETERLNRELEKQEGFLNESLKAIDTRTKIAVEQAKQRGASEKEVADIISAGLRTNAKEIEFYADKANEASKGAASNVFFQTKGALDLTTRIFTDLAGAAEALNNVKDFKVTDAFRDLNKEGKESVTQLQNALTSLIGFQSQIQNINENITLTNEEQKTEAAKKEQERQKKATEDAKKAAEERAKREAELIEAGFRDFIAKQKLRLLEVEKGGQEELAVKKDILKSELQLSLNNDKLTSNERKLLIKQYFADVRELDKEAAVERRKRTIEDSISNIKAELDALKLSFSEREALTVELLEKQRELELSQVINNKTKEKEINARFDKEIVEQRKQIREAAFAEELDTIERNAFIAQQRAKAAAADDTLPVQERVSALNEIYGHEFDLITQKRLNNQEELKDRLISVEDFNKKAKELANQEFTTRAEFEKAYSQIFLSEEEKRKAKRQETMDSIVESVNQVLTAFKTFTDGMNAVEDARIEAQRDSLQRLRELNAITEKEYIAKTKVIDRLERETKQKQAVREKEIALFEAAVNGAAAIVKAAPNAFAIVATSVLVAAQLAAIATRPIPKFGKGTKSAPEGFAQVGETGAELIRTDKGYFVAEHPQIIWMKGGERVYNPAETRDMIETPKANTSMMNSSHKSSGDDRIDYTKMAKKLGEEIAKHPRTLLNVDEDGFSISLVNKLNRTKYLNKRYTFHD